VQRECSKGRTGSVFSFFPAGTTAVVLRSAAQTSCGLSSLIVRFSLILVALFIFFMSVLSSLIFGLPSEGYVFAALHGRRLGLEPDELKPSPIPTASVYR